jgi:hypothetical protein
MPADAYVVIQHHDIDSPDEAAVSIPPELGVLLAWDKERRAGIVVTTDENDRPAKAEALFQTWGWYASAHTSATSAEADVGRFAEQF